MHFAKLFFHSAIYIITTKNVSIAFGIKLPYHDYLIAFNLEYNIQSAFFIIYPLEAAKTPVSVYVNRSSVTSKFREGILKEI